MLTNVNQNYLRACACRLALGHYKGCANRVGGAFRYHGWAPLVQPQNRLFLFANAGKPNANFEQFTNRFCDEKVSKKSTNRKSTFGDFLVTFCILDE